MVEIFIYKYDKGIELLPHTPIFKSSYRALIFQTPNSYRSIIKIYTLVDIGIRPIEYVTRLFENV